MTRQSCKSQCKRTGSDSLTREDTIGTDAGLKSPTSPRSTRPEDTGWNSVRRTFNPKVVGSIPTGPTGDCPG